MNEYSKGEKITITNSVGQKITWVATGDKQRDAALKFKCSKL